MAEVANVTEEHGWFVGEKKVFEYTVRDEDGNVVDITNHDLEWMVRPSASSDTVLLQKTSAVGGGILKNDPAGGKCRVTVDPNDTLTMEAGEFAVALRRFDGENDAVLAYGTAVLQWVAAR